MKHTDHELSQLFEYAFFFKKLKTDIDLVLFIYEQTGGLSHYL